MPITCPLCGRKNDFPLESLKENALFTCPACNVKLTLHGHMWAEIEADIRKLSEKGNG